MKIINGDRRGRPGKWLLDFYDQDGKRRRETYATQKEAKAAMADRAGEVKRSTYRAPAELPTTETVARAWLSSKSTEGLRPSTIAGLENHVHDHIVPALGGRRIDLVTLADAESLRKGLVAEKKLAPRTVNKTLAVLKAIFAYAVSAGYITRNPAAAVKAMKLGASAEVTEEQVPSAEEVSKLIDCAKEGLAGVFILTAALTGAREGERQVVLPEGAAAIEGGSAGASAGLDGRRAPSRRSGRVVVSAPVSGAP